MKKIFALSLILVLLAAAAMAQRSPGNRVRNLRIDAQLTRPESIQLRKQVFRYEVIKRRADRDAVITPYERRKLSKIKRHNRRERLRLMHNDRRRIQ